MDPITQGVFGAIAGQVPANKTTIAKASLVGALSGMAPDLDVLIRSSEDSLLFLEFHRHFTHSLLFVPFGGALCGLFFYLCLGKYWALPLRQFLLWAVLGFATHGLLGGCTSYGTRLLWPLTSERFAWDMVSVIDPIFSALLFIFAVSAIVFRKHLLTFVALAWIGVYLSVAAVQHQRAESFGYHLAEQRGHPVDRLHAKPSFGNIAVWKIIYGTPTHYIVDAVKPGLTTPASWSGAEVEKLDIKNSFPWLGMNNQQTKDIERFRWFSAGFIAVDPNSPQRIFDVRYSMLPDEITPMWGIELSAEKNAEQHVEYFTERSNGREAMGKLWEMIWQ